MATRFYQSNTRVVVPAVTPSSWSAGWNKTSGVGADFAALTVKAPRTDNLAASTINAASGTSGHFTACFREISPPLLAQTLSGNIKGQSACFEPSATDNFTLALAIKVIQSDGSDRGTLLAVSASDDTSATPPEMATSNTNRQVLNSSEAASLAISTLAVSTGDRIVFEWGYRQASTSVASGGVVRGFASATGDYAESNSGSGLNPWVEFDTDILLQPDYFGSASTPADNGTGIADPTAVTPPTGMLSGDLVCMIGQQRATGAALAVSATGGQSWTSETAIGITNQTDRLFWCQFNGTWAADPSVDFDATTCNSVQMQVFRPPSTSYTWSVNVALAETEDATSPYENPGQTTTGTNPTVTLVGWFTADDNSWDASGDTGWELAGTAQYRNTSGSDQSAAYEYKIKTAAGATGAVDKTQNTITGDACTTFAITFAATAPASFIAQKPYTVIQAVKRAASF